MHELSFQTLAVNGIQMRVALQGQGPLVLFCHGWPESWYSWRHQMAAVAAAGFRAAAPDIAAHHHQFRDHAVDALAVAQRIEQEPPKRSCAVERGVDERRIFREHIEPVGHLVFRTACV